MRNPGGFLRFVCNRVARFECAQISSLRSHYRTAHLRLSGAPIPPDAREFDAFVLSVVALQRARSPRALAARENVSLPVSHVERQPSFFRVRLDRVLF